MARCESSCNRKRFVCRRPHNRSNLSAIAIKGSSGNSLGLAQVRGPSDAGLAGFTDVRIQIHPHAGPHRLQSAEVDVEAIAQPTSYAVSASETQAKAAQTAVSMAASKTTSAAFSRRTVERTRIQRPSPSSVPRPCITTALPRRPKGQFGWKSIGSCLPVRIGGSAVGLVELFPRHVPLEKVIRSAPLQSVRMRGNNVVHVELFTSLPAELWCAKQVHETLLKREATERSLRQKRKKAGWNTDFLEKLLFAA